MFRRKDDEFFIGMVGSSYTINRKRKRRKFYRRNKTILFRAGVIALGVLVLAGLGVGGYFLLSPLFAGSAGATADEAETTTAVATTKVQATTQAPTAATSETQAPTTTEPEETKPAEGEHIVPDIADDGSKPTLTTASMCVWQGKGFNLFHSGNKAAEYYAKAINSYANKLDKDIKVYNMVVPNHTEFGLPQRLIKGGVDTDSQSENIKHIYKNLSSRVVAIDCYNALSQHCNEYIYYNTDHHWTGLGGYYGYTAFCDTLNLKPMDISKSETYKIEGFIGSLYTATNSPELAANPDTVYYYSLPNETYAYLDNDGYKYPVYYPDAVAGEFTYGVFCWGDVGQFVIHSDVKSGKKIAVVKDSYGNAFTPYLSANYDEVHMIDYRYWSGDLNQYCKKNGIKEVLFLNNTMSANTVSQVDSMATIFS